MPKKEIALVLAGGRGKRMDILGETRAKPALPFAGRFRVIDFTLSNCVNSGIKRIAALVDYRRESLADCLSLWQARNGNCVVIDTLPPRDRPYAGTADAVYQNLDFLKTGGETVLVLAGDHVYKMDYRRMMAFHRSEKADVTLGVIRVPPAETHRFGTVSVDNGHRVIEFKEKSSISQSNLASMGIYIFNREVLAERLTEDAGEPGSLHDFGYNILPRMVKKDRVFAYEFKGYWHDIGTVEAYYEANMRLLMRRTGHRLDGDQLSPGGNSVITVGRMGQQGSVVNSLISPGCVIDGYVENSILSPGVFIAAQAIVKNSVVMADTFIDYHSVVSNCILDENIIIGKYCYLGFGSGPLPGKPEITVLGRSVTVPDRTAIGHSCRVPPGSGPEAFETRLVPSGTTPVTLE